SGTRAGRRRGATISVRPSLTHGEGSAPRASGGPAELEAEHAVLAATSIDKANVRAANVDRASPWGLRSRKDARRAVFTADLGDNTGEHRVHHFSARRPARGSGRSADASSHDPSQGTARGGAGNTAD